MIKKNVPLSPGHGLMFMSIFFTHVYTLPPLGLSLHGFVSEVDRAKLLHLWVDNVHGRTRVRELHELVQKPELFKDGQDVDSQAHCRTLGKKQQIYEIDVIKVR